MGRRTNTVAPHPTNKLDTGLFGIPKEPYAFGNNWRPKLRGPNFDEIKVDVPPEGQTISITFP